MEATPASLALKVLCWPLNQRLGSPQLLRKLTVIHCDEAKNLRISFCWVPGHMRGNRSADSAMKEDANEKNPTFSMKSKSSLFHSK